MTPLVVAWLLIGAMLLVAASEFAGWVSDRLRDRQMDRAADQIDQDSRRP